MKKIMLPIVAILIFTACKNNTTTTHMIYPSAKTVDSSTNFFGTTVKDPYRWMENESDPDLATWIQQENTLTNNYLAKILYKQKIYDRLKEIFNYERCSTPFKEGGKYFFFKNDGLQNQYVLYVQDSLQAEPRILLDPNKLSEDGTIALGTTSISHNGKYLGYSISHSGSDWNEIYILNIQTGELLKDHLEWVKFSGISWQNDGFYYSRYDKPKEGKELSTANTNQKVFYHKINTKQTEDILIYQDTENPTYGFGSTVSKNEKYLIITAWKGTSGNILYFKDLTKPNAKFIQLNENFDFDYSFVKNLDGKILIRTNQDAPNYKIIAVDPENPENRTDFIPETKNVLQNITFSPQNIIVKYMEDVKSVVKIYDIKGNFQYNLQLPGIGSVGGIAANKEDDFIFYSFSSYTTPATINKYNLKTKTNEIYYKTEFKGINLDEYIVKQEFYKSKDNTKIPIFIVHKKNIELNDKNPTWLYGYGGFNISLTPRFDIRRMLWLENGGIYAVANLRGGGEYGEKWHKQGTKTNKQNVFDDFIEAAKYLINKHYTNPELIAIQGGSNGGLLIGAVTNQKPELFKVALPAVGVMDMLRFQNFTIGRAWASDYGLATDNKEMFKYIYKYSPLHNIDANKQYPAILVTTADHDDRVVPAHSFKYIANLQATKTNNKNPLLIRIDTKAGHGAGKPTEKIIQEWTDLYAFTFFNMKIEPKFENKK